MGGAGKFTWTKVSHTKDCCNHVSKTSVPYQQKSWGSLLYGICWRYGSRFPQPDQYIICSNNFLPCGCIFLQTYVGQTFVRRARLVIIVSSPPASLIIVVVSLLLCPRAFAGGGSLILYHTLPVSFVTTSFSSEKEPHARQAAAAAAEGDPKQTQEGGSILRLSIRIYHTPVSFYQEIQQPSYNHVRLYSLQVPLRDDV